MHVHRHHRAAGMVFGLALVQRVFSRYATDTEDKAQLLVRLCLENKLIFSFSSKILIAHIAHALPVPAK